MSKNKNKAQAAKDSAAKQDEPRKTVRGSGFSYDEAIRPTDQSVPLTDEEEQDIVELPELGKRNRP